MLAVYPVYSSVTAEANVIKGSHGYEANSNSDMHPNECMSVHQSKHRIFYSVTV